MDTPNTILIPFITTKVNPNATYLEESGHNGTSTIIASEQGKPLRPMGIKTHRPRFRVRPGDYVIDYDVQRKDTVMIGKLLKRNGKYYETELIPLEQELSFLHDAIRAAKERAKLETESKHSVFCKQ